MELSTLGESSGASCPNRDDDEDMADTDALSKETSPEKTSSTLLPPSPPPRPILQSQPGTPDMIAEALQTCRPGWGEQRLLREMQMNNQLVERYRERWRKQLWLRQEERSFCDPERAPERCLAEALPSHIAAAAMLACTGLKRRSNLLLLPRTSTTTAPVHVDGRTGQLAALALCEPVYLIELAEVRGQRVFKRAKTCR